jgi:histidinol dehydrogenase
MRIENWQSLNTEARRSILARPARPGDPARRTAVRQVLEQVKESGDQALRALTFQYDGVELEDLEVSRDEIRLAEAQLPAPQREAVRQAAVQIERFHAAQRTTPISVETAAGVRCERVTRPVQRVGLYVPAGSAPLPSTALMLGIPARLAGCPLRILCSPPKGPEGQVDAAVLYAAQLCGVERVFKVGGAQAIAAMAYGTESVPKVDKVFGPGNAWVTEAKAQVAQDPAGAAQDMPAGPSEVMVITDDHARPAFAAADLLSQAEHGPDSQVVLVSTSADMAQAVAAEVSRQKGALSRLDVIDQALAHSLAIVVRDLTEAMALANDYAPEHLILQIERPRDWLDQIHSAGSIFLGPWAPESVGDYCSGTNHVLPTYGFARAYSSLGLTDFQRAMTVQELTAAGLTNIGPTAVVLADMEGLDAHREAVLQRLAFLRTGEST